jgi:hypothetical protein
MEMEEEQQQYQYKPRRMRTLEERYLNDPRWKQAQWLASQSRYAECAALVARIQRAYGK